jgi:hypothetical protein
MCSFFIGWVSASPAPLLVRDPVNSVSQDADDRTVSQVANHKSMISKKIRSSRGGDGLIIFHGEEGDDLPPTPTIMVCTNSPILLNIIGQTEATTINVAGGIVTRFCSKMWLVKLDIIYNQINLQILSNSLSNLR